MGSFRGRRDEVKLNIRVNGMRNRPLSPSRSIQENVTGCLQKYVVLKYEISRKYLKFKINNIVLQIILREHNFDFHHRTGETCPAKPTCPDWPGVAASCRVNNFSSEQLGLWWIDGGNTNIADRGG
jgi:hypothetical protein